MKKNPKFDDVYVLDKEDVQRISTFDAMYLQKGDVVLVRSNNVAQLGDHYIVVTGPVVQKPHGMRPMTETIPIDKGTDTLLNRYEMKMGVTALKLIGRAKKFFHHFHDIKIDATGEVFIGSLHKQSAYAY